MEFWTTFPDYEFLLFQKIYNQKLHIYINFKFWFNSYSLEDLKYFKRKSKLGSLRKSKVGTFLHLYNVLSWRYRDSEEKIKLSVLTSKWHTYCLKTYIIWIYRTNIVLCPKLWIISIFIILVETVAFYTKLNFKELDLYISKHSWQAPVPKF